MLSDIQLLKSKLVIQRAINDFGGDKCAVACSFGKDSEVVLHLCLQQYPSMPVVFCNTGIEFKETLEFRDLLIDEWHLNYHEAKPEKNFGTIVREYGLPQIRASVNQKGGHIPKCCEYLKDRPGMKMYHDLGIKAVFTGILAEESHNRTMLAHRKDCGDYYYAKSQGLTKAHPIIWWSEQDVWDYIRSNKLPYNKHYDMFPGHRVGCAACTAYLHWEERMPLESPKWYKFVQKHRGQVLLDDVVMNDKVLMEYN